MSEANTMKNTFRIDAPYLSSFILSFLPIGIILFPFFPPLFGCESSPFLLFRGELSHLQKIYRLLNVACTTNVLVNK